MSSNITDWKRQKGEKTRKDQIRLFPVFQSSLIQLKIEMAQRYETAFIFNGTNVLIIKEDEGSC